MLTTKNKNFKRTPVRKSLTLSENLRDGNPKFWTNWEARALWIREFCEQELETQGLQWATRERIGNY